MNTICVDQGALIFRLGSPCADTTISSLNVRTACSAAGLALHLACQSIRSEECSAALVAGSNLILSPGVTSQMSEQGGLSPDGSCKTFDASANGYARGEAVNCLYIKRLDLALRDGNPIRAVIRSSSTNADGRTPGMANPSGEAHEALMRDAYFLAGIDDLSQTAMVECHGTGTPVSQFRSLALKKNKTADTH